MSEIDWRLDVVIRDPHGARDRIAELEAELDVLRRDADERRDMIELPEGMTLRVAHQLAQEGCRFFYLRPKEVLGDEEKMSEV